MINYDDRSGTKPLDVNKIHEDEQKKASSINVGGKEIPVYTLDEAIKQQQKNK